MDLHKNSLHTNSNLPFHSKEMPIALAGSYADRKSDSYDYYTSHHLPIF